VQALDLIPSTAKMKKRLVQVVESCLCGEKNRENQTIHKICLKTDFSLFVKLLFVFFLFYLVITFNVIDYFFYITGYSFYIPSYFEFQSA
jgi:hypothetical protein